MKRVFKVVFARNEVVLCKETSATLPDDIEIRYEQSNGQLIYAFVAADDLSEAVDKANQIIPRFATQAIQPPIGDPSAEQL
ncbi:hypothetical protein [Polluticoccus soli]|uniref:hypothetical protein n=1 Tax=Polluticoccus soli TaxID=3034150 RepID=UPI0023E1D638|nr:hypothetical protein [Flavipsychrobacter sp. JY13-12]